MIDRSRLPCLINGERFENFKDGCRRFGIFAADRARRAFRKELRDKRRIVRKIGGVKYTFRALA